MKSRFTFDSTRSYLQVSGRSSLHPIETETRGITGWFEASLSDRGELDLAAPVAGELELPVNRLTSGNHLYDRELRRRVNARATRPSARGWSVQHRRPAMGRTSSRAT